MARYRGFFHTILSIQSNSKLMQVHTDFTKITPRKFKPSERKASLCYASNSEPFSISVLGPMNDSWNVYNSRFFALRSVRKYRSRTSCNVYDWHLILINMRAPNHRDLGADNKKNTHGGTEIVNYSECLESWKAANQIDCPSSSTRARGDCRHCARSIQISANSAFTPFQKHSGFHSIERAPCYPHYGDSPNGENNFRLTLNGTVAENMKLKWKY